MPCSLQLGMHISSFVDILAGPNGGTRAPAAPTHKVYAGGRAMEAADPAADVGYVPSEDEQQVARVLLELATK
jgi:hypothetical protein